MVQIARLSQDSIASRAVLTGGSDDTIQSDDLCVEGYDPKDTDRFALDRRLPSARLFRMVSRTYSVVRSTRGLEVCLVERPESFIPPGATDASPIDSLYSSRRVSFERGGRYRPSGYTELDKARERLKRVRVLDGIVLTDCLTLVLGSVPAAESQDDGAALAISSDLDERAPTAANPRGYQAGCAAIDEVGEELLVRSPRYVLENHGVVCRPQRRRHRITSSTRRIPSPSLVREVASGRLSAFALRA